MPEAILATKEEEGSQRCQVCDFPVIAGHVQGVIEGEQYSLRICQSCLQYAVLCLRDSYRQNRLFDDDFEIEELCGFGKTKEILERVKNGEEEVFSAESVRKELGLEK